MTKEGQWRVRSAVFEILAEIGITFGKETFQKYIQDIFLGYLINTAASVRQTGIKQIPKIAKEFREDWIINDFIPTVEKTYKIEKTAVILFLHFYRSFVIPW